MSNKKVCNAFVNVDLDEYRPLACKPIIAPVEDDIGGHLLDNAYRFFFLAKRDTIKENATLDVLYPTPNFIKKARFDRTPPKVEFVKRVTTDSKTRVTTTGQIRAVTTPV